MRVLCLIAVAVFIVSCGGKEALKQERPPLPSEGAYYLYILGYEAEKEGKWEEAIESYRRALDLDPASSYLKTQISAMLLRMGKISEAVTIAEDVLDADPKYINALMLLGELYNAQKKTDQAIETYKRALRI
ncbi:MAG: tetratricopeptide repeat protein, partial [Thermodesulfovibrionales bacterium]|nr:tetratricopeptide repeat protein [Thermodesulfovibrionales bacterium]